MECSSNSLSSRTSRALASSPTVLLPVRDFAGMSRLDGVLSPRQRTVLTRALCTRAAVAARDAGLRLVAVSSSEGVARWADRQDTETWPDPGTGLSAAASAAVHRMGSDPWIMLHADLPLVTASSLHTVAEAGSSAPVLVPSQDGGTNVIASEGPFSFAYGVGSFHRHFAAVPHATVITAAALSIDIDSPSQLAAFPELLAASSLSP